MYFTHFDVENKNNRSINSPLFNYLTPLVEQ